MHFSRRRYLGSSAMSKQEKQYVLVNDDDDDDDDGYSYFRWDSPLELDDVIWPNKYLLQFMGAWPIPADASFTFKFFTCLRIFFATILVVSIIAAQFATILAHWGDIKILADNGCLMLIFSLTVFKHLYVVYHREAFEQMYNWICVLWESGETTSERRKYEELALAGKLITVVGYMSGICNFSSMITAAIIGKSTLIPNLEYGFDYHSTPTRQMMFFYQFLGVLCSLNGTIGCDCTMVSIILHVAGHFRLIAARFRLAIADADIARSIVMHQRALTIAKDISELLKPVVFGQLMISGVEICLSGYAVLEGDNSGADLIKFSFLLFSQLLQLLVWCWPGEQLISESSSVTVAVYNNVALWTGMAVSQQRNLAIVLLRAQRECRVLAFTQIIFMKKLTEAVNAAASYMALLRSMKK